MTDIRRHLPALLRDAFLPSVLFLHLYPFLFLFQVLLLSDRFRLLSAFQLPPFNPRSIFNDNDYHYYIEYT